MERKRSELEQHIVDTIKEWQMKIGYREESMNLYYPEESLKEMLELSEDASKEDVMRSLERFSEEKRAEYGVLQISEKNGRYCITIPVKGCIYIHENEEDSAFLESFLNAVTDRAPSFDKVRSCFAAAAKQSGETVCEQDHGTDGMGRVFYFYRSGNEECGSEGSEIDRYVYCVELDDFGMTYHRFTWNDYQKLLA